MKSEGVCGPRFLDLDPAIVSYQRFALPAIAAGSLEVRHFSPDRFSFRADRVPCFLNCRNHGIARQMLENRPYQPLKPEVVEMNPTSEPIFPAQLLQRRTASGKPAIQRPSPV
jgi:hypothetical protein